jgi:hypothetical protein
MRCLSCAMNASPEVRYQAAHSRAIAFRIVHFSNALSKPTIQPLATSNAREQSLDALLLVNVRRTASLSPT